MDAFFERLILRASTIDELLSDDFEPLPGQKSETDLAARRLAAWCRSCASGDWLQFGRRLDRDRLAIEQALAKFASVRRRPTAPRAAWIDDAIWIEAAVRTRTGIAEQFATTGRTDCCAFEHLLAPIVEQAERLLWSSVDARVSDILTESARACLRRSLLTRLSEFAAPAIYERFNAARKATTLPRSCTSKSRYDQFVDDMRAGGFRRLCEEKPVLLRLTAVITRQWIEASREFLRRLDADLTTIRHDILGCGTESRIAGITGGLSDLHNSGRSVQIVRFEDGAYVVYKPKDVRLDQAWHAMIERLNRSGPPLDLRGARTISRPGYGWTEFIAHEECSDQEGCKRYFRRAGAWLALFHCFAGTDMHQENLIAAGDHPVPIDLETLLQPDAEEHKAQDPDDQASNAALEIIGNSVMMVGLLPSFERSPDDRVIAVGGLTSDWNLKTALQWENMNSDDMQPVRKKTVGDGTPNLPHVRGRYARYADHVDDVVAGFESYARFLLRRTRDKDQGGLFDGFSGIPIRRIIRSTKFYYLLLQRIANHRTMDDGVIWSAQADFVCRLADWNAESDTAWPLLRAERSDLLGLNVPHFVSPSDGDDISDMTGISVRAEVTPGLDRARARVRLLDEREIAWQITVINQNASAAGAGKASELAPSWRADGGAAPTAANFIAAADGIAHDLSQYAIRRGTGAAWIGLDWLGDSAACQLIRLGPDLYNGVSGIAVFLAAHAVVRGCASSGELALAAMAHLRKALRGRNAAREARALGVGGAAGLGSIVYALAVMHKCLGDDTLLADAHMTANLVSDDLIAADKQLNIMGGCAGAILGLLRLYRDTRSAAALARATKCGEHLLGQRRDGPVGSRTWLGQGPGPQDLNGISHGAAGFAYSLASLSEATGRDDFAAAADDCIAFENSGYDAEHNNWPDLRTDGIAGWPCQWCHGATGIGLARLAMTKHRRSGPSRFATDIQCALAKAENNWPGRLDTLCCGTLGSIELFCEAGNVLGRNDLRERAARCLAAVIDEAIVRGDYRWDSGGRRFNLGLFRGLAGVGYTALRQIDNSLPNVLVWE